MAIIPRGDPRRDPDAPDDVIVTDTPRTPVSDPALGNAIALAGDATTPVNKVVAIGDSLTHGFQSGAIFNTDISWPAIVAWEAGVFGNYRRPHYPGFGGLPLNIELLVRELEERFGPTIKWYEAALAAFAIRHRLGEVVDYWERGPGSVTPPAKSINHDLAVFGFDLRDALSLTAQTAVAAIGTPHDSILAPIVSHAKERAALRVLPYPDPNDPASRQRTVFDAAAELGAQGSVERPGEGDGIETLFVALGANNALRTVTDLRVVWSGPGFDTLDGKGDFTVWRPTHFASELAQVVARVKTIRARNVIFGTVPHVTIAPIARGIGGKIAPGSRYYPYYTRPWIAEAAFDRTRDAHITDTQARAIDSAIDQYNDAIVAEVQTAQAAGKRWFVLDLAGLLDRLAARRYQNDPSARPDWWTPYPLPPDLAALAPVPDSRFFAADTTGRTQGGLFSLDGVHPTTIAYGVVAQEMMHVMQVAGVRFMRPDGVTPRPAPVMVDFGRLLRLDTLISDPPASISADLATIGWLNEKADLFRRLVG